MGWFNRKRKDAEAEVPEEAVEAFVAHLVNVATQAALDGTDESADRLADHLLSDMNGAPRQAVLAALGMLVISEGARRADTIRRSALEVIQGLMANMAQEDQQEGQERPTDLLPDDEPSLAPEAVSEPHTAAEANTADEKDWPEDRR